MTTMTDEQRQALGELLRHETQSLREDSSLDLRRLAEGLQLLTRLADFAEGHANLRGGDEDRLRALLTWGREEMLRTAENEEGLLEREPDGVATRKQITDDRRTAELYGAMLAALEDEAAAEGGSVPRLVRDTIRALLQDSSEPDPRVIARRLSMSMDDKQRAQALTAGLETMAVLLIEEDRTLWPMGMESCAWLQGSSA